MSHPNAERDGRVDPELDALSWSPSAEEADAYLRGHGVIKKCEHCGQDATLTNDFVSHLLARFGERMREADDAATRMRDRCVAKVESIMDSYKEQAEHSNDDGKRRLAWMADAAETIATELQSLTLEGEQEQSK